MSIFSRKLTLINRTVSPFSSCFVKYYSTKTAILPHYGTGTLDNPILLSGREGTVFAEYSKETAFSKFKRLNFMEGKELDRTSTNPLISIGRWHYFFGEKGSPVIYGCGRGREGQLGNEFLNDVQFLHPVKLPAFPSPVLHIACASYFTIVHLENGELYHFGLIPSNSIAKGDQNDAHMTNINKKPIKLSFTTKMLDANGEVEEIICTDRCVFILFTNGRLFAFGEERFGELMGLNNSSSSSMKESTVCVELSHNLGLAQNGDEKLEKIACGFGHIIAKTSNGRLFSWGANHHGQLGHETNNNNNDNNDNNNSDGDNDDDNDDGVVVRAKNSSQAKEIVFSNGKGKGKNVKVKDVACGATHSVALLENGEVYIWGSSGDGKLGGGREMKDAYSPKKLDLPCEISRIACGGDHTLFFAESNGKLFGCGFGQHGALGCAEKTDDRKNYSYIEEETKTTTARDKKKNKSNDLGKRLGNTEWNVRELPWNKFSHRLVDMRAAGDLSLLWIDQKDIFRNDNENKEKKM